MSDELGYGYCMVIGGKHKGQVVYYDDDNETNKSAYCYFGHYLDGHMSVIPKRFLREATAEEVGAHQYDNDELWGTGRKEIFREVYIEDARMLEEDDIVPGAERGPINQNTGEPKRLIDKDITKQLENVMRAGDDLARRKQLLRLIVLATSWIGVIDDERRFAKAEQSVTGPEAE